MRLSLWSRFGFCCVMAVMMTGCGNNNQYREVAEEDLTPVEEHDHHHAAPHGGRLVELGSHEYNAEFVVTATDPKLTVYIYDAHAEKAVAAQVEGIALTLKVADDMIPVPLKAAPQAEEAEGTASQFLAEGTVPQTLTDAHDLEGTFKVTINEKAYEAKFSHDDEHDHEHGDHDH